MEFIEYPKWLHPKGRPDVLVQTADEEAAHLSKWADEDGGQNRLVAAQPETVTEVVTTRIVPPAEPRAQQLAVEIPDDWRDLPYLPKKAGEPSLKSLAAKVSNTPVTDKAVAIAAIEAELAKRA